jgi:hypothetical protein
MGRATLPWRTVEFRVRGRLSNKCRVQMLPRLGSNSQLPGYRQGSRGWRASESAWASSILLCTEFLINVFATLSGQIDPSSQARRNPALIVVGS